VLKLRIAARCCPGQLILAGTGAVEGALEQQPGDGTRERPVPGSCGPHPEHQADGWCQFLKLTAPLGSRLSGAGFLLR
jgi:hypothetical protein